MIWTTKNWIILAVVIAVFVFGVLLVRKIISDGVAKQTQEIQEKFAKQVADEKLKCENNKLEAESSLKKRIVEVETELEKTKIILDKIQKQGKVTESIKKDVKGFMKNFDKLIGTKGKTSEQAK